MSRCRNWNDSRVSRPRNKNDGNGTEAIKRTRSTRKVLRMVTARALCDPTDQVWSGRAQSTETSADSRQRGKRGFWTVGAYVVAQVTPNQSLPLIYRWIADNVRRQERQRPGRTRSSARMSTLGAISGFPDECKRRQTPSKAVSTRPQQSLQYQWASETTLRHDARTMRTDGRRSTGTAGGQSLPQREIAEPRTSATAVQRSLSNTATGAEVLRVQAGGRGRPSGAMPWDDKRRGKKKGSAKRRVFKRTNSKESVGLAVSWAKSVHRDGFDLGIILCARARTRANSNEFNGH